MSQPVVIAGAGPVGLMLACELGLAEVETVVVERLECPSEQSRGMAINAAVVELLAQRGLMEGLRGDGFEFPQAHFAHIFLNPAALAPEHPFSFAVPHTQLAHRLEERATKLGVQVRRGAEITGVTQDETGVSVDLRTSAGPESIRGCYLVGCDGQDSTVRALAGTGFPGTEARFSGIIGDVAADPGDPLLGKFGVNQHRSGFFTVAPLGPQTLRVATGEFDVDPADRAAPVTRDELRAAIERIAEADLKPGEPRWLSRWGSTTKLAERYRAGRVFVAGDAAHVFFPLGGQALSTGIEDAVNLGWKLAAEVNGWAAPGLLDTYHSERHPVGARACLTSRAQEALLHRMDTVAPLREFLGELVTFPDVNAFLVKVAGGLDVRYPEGQHPLAGSRFGNVPLSTAAGETSIADLMHSGRGLFLTFGQSAGPQDEVFRWAHRIDVVSATPPAEIPAQALLLRPDGRVAWAAGPDGEAGLPQALRTWFGEPGPARAG